MPVCAASTFNVFVDKDSPCFYIDSLTVDTSPMNIELVYESKINNIVELIKNENEDSIIAKLDTDIIKKIIINESLIFGLMFNLISSK